MPGDEERHPAALEELHDRERDQDGGRQHEAEAVDRELVHPAPVRRPLLPPVPDHAGLGEREGDEHVDRVEDDEEVHGAPRHQHHDERGRAHEQDPVHRHEALAQVGEARREPAVERHVRQDAGAVEEPGLRGDDQERGLGEQGDDDEGAPGPVPPAGGHALEEHGVERLVRVDLDAVELVGDEEAGDRDRKRRPHVDHGPAAGLHARLAQDWKPVAHGLDPRVGARPHAVGPAGGAP